MGGGMDDGAHKGTEAVMNGKRHVAYLNRNDAKRKLNLNWMDDDWNGNYHFLAVRNFYWREPECAEALPRG